MKPPFQEIHPSIAAFMQVRVLHRNMSRLIESIRAKLMMPDRNALLFVCGVTGTGKTALLDELQNMLIAECAVQLKIDLERIPVVRAVALPPKPGHSFDFSEFYRELLKAIDEIGIDHKTSHADLTACRPLYRRRGFEATFNGRREALEMAFERRRPSAVLIDEAQAMAMSRAAARENHFEQIKSVANRGKVPFVLTGSYNLASFALQDSQVIRRGECFEYERYRPNNETDINEFTTVAAELGRALPTRKPTKFNPETIAYLFEGSLGCIGLLKDWLTRALARMIIKKSAKVTQEDLEAEILSTHSRETLIRDIHEGEARFRLGVTEEMLRLKLRSESAPFEKASKPIVAVNSAKRVPFEPTPARDPVGTL